MKQTDGLFHQVFDEIAREYPEIRTEHWIIDIGAAMLADTPEIFDVIVMPNLYGDVLSDVAAQIAGSVGLAGSANIGETCAMFEAIHGSAPKIAGQGIANPSGLLQAAVQMLVHIGQTDVAERIQNAWLKTIEDGIHTFDIYKEGVSRRKVSTQEFAEAIVRNIGEAPSRLVPVKLKAESVIRLPRYKRREPRIKELQGVDLFIHWTGTDAAELAQRVVQLNTDTVQLSLITNRGIKVWPDGFPETFCTDHWRCRFKGIDGRRFDKQEILRLLEAAQRIDLDVIKTENLYAFDGKEAFSMGQGQ